MKVFMKIGALVVLFALILSLSVWAADQQELRFITVTGDAEVKVIPDEVVIVLGVESQNKNLGIAKNENDEVVRKVLAITKKYKVDPKHVQTSQISIEPKYRYTHEKKIFEGYFVKKTIVITLKDISKFENILSGALESGVNYVHQIQFCTTELRKLRDKARIIAIKAAYDKAKALAGELGQKVGKPYRIDEQQSGWISRYDMMRRAQNIVGAEGSATTESTLAPGQITVTAKVTVKFELK